MSDVDHAQIVLAHTTSVANTRDALKAAHEAYTKHVEAMGRATPGSGAIGAAPKPKKNDPAAHLHYASAASRALSQAHRLIEQAHAELNGHAQFAQVADEQFAAFLKTQTQTQPQPK